MRKSLLAVFTVVGLIGVGMSTAHAAGVRYVDLLFSEVDVTTNVIYGQARNVDGVMQDLDLDIYQGRGDDGERRGLYIWAHGGNFRVGSKNEKGPSIDYAKRGWVAMSINYRLDPEGVPPNAAIGVLTEPGTIEVTRAAARAAQHDMQAAVRWARAHAAELRIDPNKIAVAGGSAGAITALATAFNPGDAGNSGTPGHSSVVQAAVSHAGAYVPGLQGAAPAAGAPAIAIYHGTNDEQVPYGTSLPACVLTLLMQNDCEYVTFFARNHNYMGFDLARDFLYRHVILGRTELRTPLVANLQDNPIQVLAGIEPAGSGIGVTAGLVSSTDPNEIAEGFLQLVRYAGDALGAPLPF